MNILTKLAFATLAAGVLPAAGAFAEDSVYHAVDTHHGSMIFLTRPVQQETTFAFGGHAKATTEDRATSRKTNSVQRQELRLHQASTPHGNVSYFAPGD